MIHPDTRLEWISEAKGYGVIATRLIPKGSITFAQDRLDIVVKPGDDILDDPNYQDMIEKYSYLDKEGNQILSWDHAKFVNHCCFPNTLTTGYGFEIAIRDIHPGEEITDDYGLFTTKCVMKLDCHKEGCRKQLSIDQFETLCFSWDNEVKEALEALPSVDQPLAKLLSQDVHDGLLELYQDPSKYLSVIGQKPLEELNRQVHHYHS